MEHPTANLHGYDLMQATGVSSGTLYPMLLRFEEEGWLTSVWEKADPTAEGRPRRRLYRITASGKRAASQILADLGMGVAI
jgi:DNA-binding PadR family transcriptional regulator